MTAYFVPKTMAGLIVVSTLVVLVFSIVLFNLVNWFVVWAGTRDEERRS